MSWGRPGYAPRLLLGISSIHFGHLVQSGKLYYSFWIILNLTHCLFTKSFAFQLEKRVQFHEHLRPVCLPTAATNLAPGTLCTVIGWGKKNDTDCTYHIAIYTRKNIMFKTFTHGIRYSDWSKCRLLILTHISSFRFSFRIRAGCERGPGSCSESTSV